MTRGRPDSADRNALMVAMLMTGVGQRKTAEQFGISQERVSQIVRWMRKKGLLSEQFPRRQPRPKAENAQAKPRPLRKRIVTERVPPLVSVWRQSRVAELTLRSRIVHTPESERQAEITSATGRLRW